MILSIIVAKGKNNAIGKDNKLLWHISEDLKHFKQITSGHTIVMGRKTFESIGKPLPNRRNIIVSLKMKEAPAGTELAKSIDDVFRMCKDEDEVFIIGGGEIYRQTIALADKLYITQVDVAPQDADTFFPPIDIETLWTEYSREDHDGFSFINYIRY